MQQEALVELLIVLQATIATTLQSRASRAKVNDAIHL
jgi:hypothetical protein